MMIKEEVIELLKIMSLKYNRHNYREFVEAIVNDDFDLIIHKIDSSIRTILWGFAEEYEANFIVKIAQYFEAHIVAAILVEKIEYYYLDVYEFNNNFNRILKVRNVFSSTNELNVKDILQNIYYSKHTSDYIDIYKLISSSKHVAKGVCFYESSYPYITAIKYPPSKKMLYTIRGIHQERKLRPTSLYDYSLNQSLSASEM